MPELNSSIAADVAAACRTNSAELAQALGRVFGVDPTLEIGEPAEFDLAAQASTLTGPGLAVLLSVGGSAAVAIVPESSKLLPEWYAAPDVTGTSKLGTLAQEASLLLLPESLMAEEFRAQRVDDVVAALERAKPAADAVCLAADLTTADGRSGPLAIIFPFAAGDQLFIPPEFAKAVAEGQEESTREKPAGVLRGEEAARAVAAAEAQQASPTRPTPTLADLPNYTKSLLRIQVPVMVTLAVKKQPVSSILEIGPGMILQFKKSCDQLLELEVNGHPIGVGEAVKVGDKFGLRVTSLTLPGERFKPLGRAS